MNVDEVVTEVVGPDGGYDTTTAEPVVPNYTEAELRLIALAASGRPLTSEQRGEYARLMAG